MRLVKYESYIVTVKSASCLCYISRMCLFLKKPAVVVWLFLIFLEALMIQVYSLIFMLMMR